MPRNRRSVFISSTSTDLQPERAAAIAALTRLSMLPIAMEHFAADPRQPAEVIRERLSEADAVLLLMGSRMGSKLPNSQTYYTELEYEIAYERGLPIYVLTPHESRQLRSNQASRTTAESKALSTFRSLLESRHTTRTWKESNDISTEVISIFSQPSSFRPGASKPPATKATLRTKVQVRTSSQSQTEARPARSPEIYPERALNVFRENFIAFSDQTKIIEERLRTAILQHFPENRRQDFHFESRTKTFESLVEKVTRPSKSAKYNRLSDVSDLCGVRIVAYYQGDIETIRKVVENAMPGAKVEEKNPTDSRYFGYRSTHITAPTAIQIKGQGIFLVEIQIRTFLQHTWAQIEHQLGYKAHKYDYDTQRLFAQVAALLEVADSKFGEARHRQLTQYDLGRSVGTREPLVGNKDSTDRDSRLRSRSTDKALTTITESSLRGYFDSSAWGHSTLSAALVKMPFGFLNIEGTRASAQEMDSICDALVGAGVSTIDRLQGIIEIYHAKIESAVAGTFKLRPFEDLSALDVLWFVALISEADKAATATLRRRMLFGLMEQHNLFPKEDREQIVEFLM